MLYDKASSYDYTLQYAPKSGSNGGAPDSPEPSDASKKFHYLLIGGIVLGVVIAIVLALVCFFKPEVF